MSTDTSAVANLSPQQMKDTAYKAPQQKEVQHNALVRSGGVTKFIQMAQNSLLFQPDNRWDDMLSGAPLSIAVMGAIFVASTASSADKVTILPPKEGFKYISTFTGSSGEMSLQAALVQVASKGSQAFQLASKNMQAIASYSDDIISKVDPSISMPEEKD